MPGTLPNAVDKLAEFSLPTAPLALAFEGVMAENWRLLDQRFIRSKGEGSCAWVCNKNTGTASIQCLQNGLPRASPYIIMGSNLLVYTDLI